MHHLAILQRRAGRVDRSPFLHEILEALIHQHGVEDVDLRFVDEEGFEQECDEYAALAEDEEGPVDPCAGPAVEDS